MLQSSAVCGVCSSEWGALQMKNQVADWHPATGFRELGGSGLIDRLTAEAQSARGGFDYRGWIVTEAGTVKRGHYGEAWDAVADRAGARYSMDERRTNERGRA